MSGEGVSNPASTVDVVVSTPPETFKKITDIYVDPETGKLVVIHEE